MISILLICECILVGLLKQIDMFSRNLKHLTMESPSQTQETSTCLWSSNAIDIMLDGQTRFTARLSPLVRSSCR